MPTWRGIFKGTVSEEIYELINQRNFKPSPVPLEQDDLKLGELNDFEKAIFTLIREHSERLEDLIERVNLMTRKKINCNDKEKQEIVKKINKEQNSIETLRLMIRGILTERFYDDISKFFETTEEVSIAIKKPYIITIEKTKQENENEDFFEQILKNPDLENSTMQ